jgi:SAM-dependent methyltransferase
MGPNPLESLWGRKYWEWRYIVECARELDLLKAKTRALGTGVGKEPVMFYFARILQDVVATDLFSQSTIWHEARCHEIEQVYEASPFPYPREHLKIYSADMRQVPEESGSFDFVWSCGSLEHVPTLFDTYLSLKEIHRLLKPGGYAIITTEYCLSEPPYLLPGLNALDSDTVQGYIGGLNGLQLVGPTDLSYNWLAPAGAVRPRRYLLNSEPTEFHAGYLPRDYVHVVGVSAITPIGFVLQKVNDNFTEWASLKLPEEVSLFEYIRRISDPNEIMEKVGKYIYGTAECSTQYRLFVFAEWVRAKFSREYPAEELLHDLNFLDSIIPPGQLQDPNLMEMFGSYAAEKGLWNYSSKYFIAASRTLSSLPHDSVRLAAFAFVIGEVTQEHKLVRDNFREIVTDLVARAYPQHSIQKTIEDIQGAPTYLKEEMLRITQECPSQ